ncbi:DotU family type IV/VI secretion system protein [Insolitispirillum peregrinum]|uniref:Type VI secretion system protein ImpK n=1 Tax=Insolitispirillum peregrinum TaxID=80876 RepID=A0A1N7JGJ9_9PROT|nr:DotU family type IV/VI secretion system protein [Insolitispirillum peregrinum]SIS48430.1 type VI secretion system protein ImpK [Insolitispirillum peregrinum]
MSGTPSPHLPPVLRPGLVPPDAEPLPEAMPLAGLTTLPDGRKAGFLVFQFRAFYAGIRLLVDEARAAGARADQGVSFTGLSADAALDPQQVPPSSVSASPIPPSLIIPPAASPAMASPLPAGKPVDLVERMVRQICQRLEEGAAEAARLGGAYGAAIYRDAKYMMAALADETFLHEVEWEGRLVWRDTLVETRLFGSSISGERVFRLIDALLDGGDPLHIELASIYLMVLTLGFKGRYRGDGEAILETYRQRLRDFIGLRLPAVLPSEPVFASSYAHTLDEGREQFLPAIRPWIWAVVIFVLGYLLISHGLWVWLTGPVRAIIGEG